jgi:hypothetical protein
MKSGRGPLVLDLSRAQASRKPQQDVPQLYRIAASVQSRVRIVARLRNGVKPSHETGSLDYPTNNATRA